ncbi:hypothetical protein U1Q18_049772 [Sarracenia purpurea var. burkii]
MLLGFISLLLTVFQIRINRICIPSHLADQWLPCKKPSSSPPKSTSHSQKSIGAAIGRHLLAGDTGAADYCKQQKQPPLPPTIPPIFHISSVRIEENPSKTSTQPSKKQSRSSSANPKKPTYRKAPSTSVLVPPPSRRKEEPSLVATIFNALDGIIDTFIDHPICPSVDPRYVLSDEPDLAKNRSEFSQKKIEKKNIKPDLHSTIL